MKVGHLYRLDFDNLESKRKLATFTPGGTLTAYGKASQYLNYLAPTQHYLGWDNRVYPQFIYEEEEAL